MKAIRLVRRRVTTYIRDVQAAIAPLPDPPEEESCSDLKNSADSKRVLIDPIRVLQTFPLALKEYGESWKTLFHRGGKTTANTGTSAYTTGFKYKYSSIHVYRYGNTSYKEAYTYDNISSSSSELETVDFDLIASKGREGFEALKECLFEFLRGYREGKEEEEKKGPIDLK
eukprot:CAMPEP_0204827904 /NCGR_PEP_ID=MMETSP1346-20131115/5443_1 /ASSEMBLY_ACC=CAM_ASM_000771 /TAXON_ID=215587 /ORGANISM="Aplanochytrium stocchinoi, Strain GSBS06" /LENGTH=170 /DNA_ID=CAMNT_0051956583 /DNA_START=190 /DNA_END=702 /DNA_ORIENTATION=+